MPETGFFDNDAFGYALHQCPSSPGGPPQHGTAPGPDLYDHLVGVAGVELLDQILYRRWLWNFWAVRRSRPVNAAWASNMSREYLGRRLTGFTLAGRDSAELRLCWRTSLNR